MLNKLIYVYFCLLNKYTELQKLKKIHIFFFHEQNPKLINIIGYITIIIMKCINNNLKLYKLPNFLFKLSKNVIYAVFVNKNMYNE
jgi:hypothetical protein